MPVDSGAVLNTVPAPVAAVAGCTAAVAGSASRLVCSAELASTVAGVEAEVGRAKDAGAPTVDAAAAGVTTTGAEAAVAEAVELAEPGKLVVEPVAGVEPLLVVPLVAGVAVAVAGFDAEGPLAAAMAATVDGGAAERNDTGCEPIDDSCGIESACLRASCKNWIHSRSSFGVLVVSTNGGVCSLGWRRLKAKLCPKTGFSLTEIEHSASGRITDEMPVDSDTTWNRPLSTKHVRRHHRCEMFMRFWITLDLYGNYTPPQGERE